MNHENYENPSSSGGVFAAASPESGSTQRDDVLFFLVVRTLVRESSAEPLPTHSPQPSSPRPPESDSTHRRPTSIVWLQCGRLSTAGSRYIACLVPAVLRRWMRCGGVFGGVVRCIDGCLPTHERPQCVDGDYSPNADHIPPITRYLPSAAKRTGMTARRTDAAKGISTHRWPSCPQIVPCVYATCPYRICIIVYMI